MLADLDLLLIAVFCSADDLLPEPRQERQTDPGRRGGRHSRRRAGDHGDRSDRRFLAVAGTRLAHLFPTVPKQPGSGCTRWSLRMALHEHWRRALPRSRRKRLRSSAASPPRSRSTINSDTPPAPSSTPAPHRAQPRREQSDETVGVNPRAAHVGHVSRTAAEPVLPPHESNRPASGTPRGAIATI